jgi:transcriptional regulator with XRE-family HTH domain
MFSEIETRREMAGIDQKALCARAGIHETTYTARKNGRRGLSEATLVKLDAALRALIDERLKVLGDMVEGQP